MFDFDYLKKMCIKVSNFDMQIDDQSRYATCMPYVFYDLWNKRNQLENVNLGKN